MPRYGAKDNARGGKKPMNGKKKPKKKKYSVKGEKLKAKKLASKQLKEEFGDALKGKTREELRELKKIAHKAVIKERVRQMKAKVHSGLASVEIRSPYRPLKATVAWDFASADMFIRALLEQLSMEFPFLNPENCGVAPYQFRFYCLTLIVAYLSVVGKVTGTLSTKVPKLLETFKVPNALAKYMEYLGPASRLGAQQTTEFIFETDLNATTDAVGNGDGLNQVPPQGGETPISYVNQQLNLILTMGAVPQPTMPDNLVPTDQPNFPYTEFTTTVKWSDWMNTAGNMDLVSNVLQRFKIPCVECSWLPGAFGGNKRGYAPDASAYTFYNGDLSILGAGIQDAVPPGACWLNIHDDYDPDLAFLFSLNKVAETTPSIAAKPLPMPLYDYNTKYVGSGLANPMPWYCQPFYVAIWLANKCDVLKRGHWKDLTIKGSRICSLFPNVRVTGGISFYTLVAHCYQQIQILQQEATKKGTTGVGTEGGFANENAQNWNWWTLVSCASQAMQRRFNENQIVVCNSPVFANGVGPPPLLFPQCNWVDSAAADVDLPVSISKAIDSLGPVIYRGRLLIPMNPLVNDSVPIAYPVPVNAQYGPIAWSANGFNATQLQVYPYENLQTPVTFGPSPPVQLNVNLDRLALNNTYTNLYLGWDNAELTLYPFFLGGQWVQQMAKLLATFMLGGNPVNTLEKNMEPPEMPVLGNGDIMASETLLNPNSIESTPLVPNNLPTTGGVNQVNLSIIRTVVAGATSQTYSGEAAAFRVAEESLVQDSNQPISNSDTANRSTVSRLFAVVNNQAPAPATLKPPSGMLNFTTRAGNSFNALISQACHNLIKPDSQFGKQKALIDHARNSLGQLVPKNKKAVIEKLSTNRAFMTELGKLSVATFGAHDRTPHLAPETIGKVGKGMTPAAASTLAIVDSNSQITSSDSTAPQDKVDPKHKRLKLDGKRIKKISKSLVSTASKVGQGVDDAVKHVSHIADVAGKTVEEIGSIFI